MERVITLRSRTVAEAQNRIAKLTKEEEETAARLAQLKQVRPEAAEAINDLMNDTLERRDKQSMKRDLVIFILGVVVSVLVQVVYGLAVGDISLPKFPR